MAGAAQSLIPACFLPNGLSSVRTVPASIAEKFGLSANQVRELMLRVGNDRDDVEKAARELSGRSQGRSDRQ
jgi:hypothetical protein